MNLGIALARQRQFTAARAQIREALRREPRNRRALEFLSAIDQMQRQEQKEHLLT